MEVFSQSRFWTRYGPPRSTEEPEKTNRYPPYRGMTRHVFSGVSSPVCFSQHRCRPLLADHPLFFLLQRSPTLAASGVSLVSVIWAGKPDQARPADGLVRPAVVNVDTFGSRATICLLFFKVYDCFAFIPVSHCRCLPPPERLPSHTSIAVNSLTLNAYVHAPDKPGASSS